MLTFLFHIKQRLLLFLFLIAPFIHILKVNIGNGITYSLYVSILFILLLIHPVSNDFKSLFNNNIFIFHLLLLNIFLVLCYKVIVYGVGNYFDILFYGAHVIIFYSFIIIGIRDFVKKYYVYLLQYFFILSGLFIIADFIILNESKYGYESSLMHDETKAIAIDPDGSIRSRTDIYRPLGLFGQASVNSGVFVFLYILILAENYKHVFLSRLASIIYTLLAIVVVILQASGLGGIMLITFYLLNKISMRRLTMYSIICALIYCLSFFYVGPFDFMISDKLTGPYIYSMLDLFFREWGEYSRKIYDIPSLLFGVNPLLSFESNEFGQIKLLARMGLLYFTLYIIWILLLIRKSPNKTYVLAFILLFTIGSHYEIMFWSYFMAFLWSLIYYRLLLPVHVKKKKNDLS